MQGIAMIQYLSRQTHFCVLFFFYFRDAVSSVAVMGCNTTIRTIKQTIDSPIEKSVPVDSLQSIMFTHIDTRMVLGEPNKPNWVWVRSKKVCVYIYIYVIYSTKHCSLACIQVFRVKLCYSISKTYWCASSCTCMYTHHREWVADQRVWVSFYIYLLYKNVAIRTLIGWRVIWFGSFMCMIDQIELFNFIVFYMFDLGYQYIL